MQSDLCASVSIDDTDSGRDARIHLKLLAPDGLSPSAVTERISRLNHKVFDHTMEDQAVVVPM